MSGWEDLLGPVGEEEDVSLSQSDSALTQEAEACRSPSVEGDDVPVPLTPQTSDVWWVQNVKAATRALHPEGINPMEHPMTLLSNCTGSFAEVSALQAGGCGPAGFPGLSSTLLDSLGPPASD